MRQVREVLRLKHAANLSERQIAASLRISRSTVAEYVRRATVVGVTWPVPGELDDATLEARLFSPPFAVREAPRPQPDWARLHAELRRPNVTLLLLWEEYRAGQPDGYGYSRFCDLYREWRGRICGKRIPPGSDCLSITLAKPCRSLIRLQARCGTHKSSSQH
jgi:transcriptional regulator with XRE-family HTH domain